MNKTTKRTLGMAAFLTWFFHAQGQGTITFDGPPLQPPNSAYTVHSYSELGMWFASMPGTCGFGRMGRNPSSGWPDNGTAYVQAALGDSLQFGLENGGTFDLVAVDLAEYSVVFPAPVVVRFVGWKPDGSKVTNELVTDGIIDGTGPLADFETLHFGPQFVGLTRVQVATMLWSLDNLVFDIPEPTSGALIVAGAILAFRRHARSRCST